VYRAYKSLGVKTTGKKRVKKPHLVKKRTLVHGSGCAEGGKDRGRGEGHKGKDTARDRAEKWRPRGHGVQAIQRKKEKKKGNVNDSKFYHEGGRGGA